MLCKKSWLLLTTFDSIGCSVGQPGFLMQHYSNPQFINVGTGDEVSIKELALTIKAVVGYNGELQFDPTKPDGTPRKLLDISRLTAIGWQPRTSLKEGLEKTYHWLVANYESIRGR